MRNLPVFGASTRFYYSRRTRSYPHKNNAPTGFYSRDVVIFNINLQITNIFTNFEKNFKTPLRLCVDDNAL